MAPNVRTVNGKIRNKGTSCRRESTVFSWRSESRNILMQKQITQYDLKYTKRKQEDKAPIQALFCTQIQVAQQTSQDIAAALGPPPEQLLVVFIIQGLVYNPKKPRKKCWIVVRRKCGIWAKGPRVLAVKKSHPPIYHNINETKS